MRNIKLSEYIKLKDHSEFNFLDALKPKNNFNGNALDISTLTYSEVKSVMKTLRTLKGIEDVFDVFVLCFKCDLETFYNSKIIEFVQAKKHLLKTFKELNETEAKLLQSVGVDAMLWQSAGGDKLNAFSDVLSLMQLGEIYSIYPLDLGEKMYLEILTLLKVHKIKSEVDASYQNLKSKQK